MEESGDTAPLLSTSTAMALEQAIDEGKTIVLFDGVCNMCNGFVNFTIDRDPDRNLRFAALQSTVGSALLDRFGLDNDLSTIVVVEGDYCYTRSTAVLRVMSRLAMPWPMFYWLLIGIPGCIRDVGYKCVAAVRYKLFGKEESCRMPTPEFKSRFLDWNEPSVNVSHSE
jgi:predicted DCC family thiol-disulfide oxidoreductase YuxK